MIKRFGLALGSLRLSILQSIYQVHRLDWFTPDGILIFFLPALLFEVSLKINLRQLARILFPLSSLLPSELCHHFGKRLLGVLVGTIAYAGAPPFWGNRLRYRRKRVCRPKMFTGGPTWINVAPTLK